MSSQSPPVNPAEITAPFSPTAQTGGFAQAGTDKATGGLGSSPNVPHFGATINPETGKPHTAGLTREDLEAKKAAQLGSVAFGGGGDGSGLGSSPNVPQPGTSINPETGKPHTAGLTRAELQAKKEAQALNATAVDPAVAPQHQTDGLSSAELSHIQSKGAGLLDPAPQTEQVRRGSNGESGREQAARQLSGAVLSPKAPPFIPSTAVEPTPAPKSLSATSIPPVPQSSSTGTASSAPRKLSATTIPDNFDAASSAGSSTPGQELPGGWGHTKPTPLPGTGPDAPSTLYEDVAEGLGKVGQAAFAAIPTPIKDRFHASPSPPGSPNSAGLSTSAGRRSSASGLFDQAKAQASKVASDLGGTLSGTYQSTQRRASENFGPDGSIRKQVKTFIDEAFESTKHMSNAEFGLVPTGPNGRFAVIPRNTRPSEETAGILPGEHTGGVGALPGSVNDSGVAILPEEKRIDAQVNQGVRLGEASPTGAATPAIGGASSAAGPSGTSDTRSVPADKETSTGEKLTAGVASLAAATGASSLLGSNSAQDSTNNTKAVVPVSDTVGPGGPSGLSGASTNTTAPAPSAGTSSTAPVLAPPLPLTTSAALGASPTSASSSPSTTAPGSVSSLSSVQPSQASPTNTNSTAASGGLALVPETRHGNDRTTSSASTTAIHHGAEGTVGKSPLAQSTVPEGQATDSGLSGKEKAAIGAGAGAGAVGLAHTQSGEKSAVPEKDLGTTSTSTTGNTGTGTTSNAISLTPGQEHHGVGHPATRNIEGTAREPGTYPAADHTRDTVDDNKDSSGLKQGVAAGTQDTTAKSNGAAQKTDRELADVPRETTGRGGFSDGHPATTATTTTNGASKTPTKPTTTTTSGQTPKASTDSGHSRNASTGSGSGTPAKKMGFMRKLKEKLK